jgi:TatD DNase family protein
MIIDTHTHLDDKRYIEDLDEVIKRAQDGGVKGFVIPGANIDDLQRAQEISHKYDNIFFAAGIHPYNLEGYDEDILRSYLKDERCIAVGECGLDYFRLPKDEKEKTEVKINQQEIFIKQIKLANELKKPLIVHIRDANDDSRRILEKYNAGEFGGVLHCYNASKHLLPLSERGFYFGIGGVLTFKNAKNLIEILPNIPKEKLLIETDSPYLTPTPHRGERNEPIYTTFVAKKISEILDMSLSEIEDLTTKNAKTLFKPLKSVI